MIRTPSRPRGDPRPCSESRPTAACQGPEPSRDPCSRLEMQRKLRVSHQQIRSTDYMPTQILVRQDDGQPVKGGHREGSICGQRSSRNPVATFSPDNNCDTSKGDSHELNSEPSQKENHPMYVSATRQRAASRTPWLNPVVYCCANSAPCEQDSPC